MIVLRDKLFMLGTYERGADGKLKRTGTIANGSGVSLTQGIKDQQINSSNSNTVADNLVANSTKKNEKAQNFFNSSQNRTDNSNSKTGGLKNAFKAFMGGFKKNGLEGGLKTLSGKGGGAWGKGLATIATLGKAAWDMKQQLSQPQEDPGMMMGGGMGYGGYQQPMYPPQQPMMGGYGYQQPMMQQPMMGGYGYQQPMYPPQGGYGYY